MQDEINVKIIYIYLFILLLEYISGSGGMGKRMTDDLLFFERNLVKNPRYEYSP